MLNLNRSEFFAYCTTFRECYILMNQRSYLYQVQERALVDGVGDGVDLLGDVKHVLVVGLVVLDATLLWTVRYNSE